MGRIFRPTRPLLDAAGQPIIGPDGKPSLVVGWAKAVPAQLWEITDEAERAVPKVDLGFGKK